MKGEFRLCPWCVVLIGAGLALMLGGDILSVQPLLARWHSGMAKHSETWNGPPAGDRHRSI